MTYNEMETALENAGFKLNKTGDRWVGFDVDLKVEHIQHLELWELDQILAGVREGADAIPLGDQTEFLLREDEA